MKNSGSIANLSKVSGKEKGLESSFEHNLNIVRKSCII